jgi:cytochrome c553
VVAVSGCGGVLVAPDDDGGMSGSGGGTGTGGGSAVGGGGGSTSSDGGVDGLSCDIAAILTSKCISCHGATLAGGAPWPILTRGQLGEIAPGWAVTKAERSLVRMQAQTMPPGGGNTPAELTAMSTWISAGMPAGTCGSVDAGPAPTTCATNASWTGGNRGSTNMNPGMACLACHKALGDGPAAYFMGTIYPAPHEKNTCYAHPPSGTVVEIIGANGTVLTLPVSLTSGNFMSNAVSAGVTMPYTARVKNAAGRTTVMTTPQTNGDCNTCHTEQGNSGAPGRITWPQ